MTDHTAEALRRLDAAEGCSIPQRTNALIGEAQVHATLALADVTRTANLIAVHEINGFQLTPGPDPLTLSNQILARLGLTETDTP